MRKFIVIILALVSIVYLAGCGKKQQPISEIQEPISMEELGKLDTSIQTAPEMAAKTAPTVTPSSEIAQAPTPLEQLPPPGPYKPTVHEIQTALKNAGYYTGLIDGKKGPLTKKAIEDFQKANSLQVDGKVGPKTWAALSKYLNPEPTPPVPARKKR